MKRLVAVLALMLVLVLPSVVVAAGWAPPARPVGSTGAVIGQVVEFPTEWPCFFWDRCTAPVATSFEVWRAGVRIRTVETNSNGRFNVRLRPGLYTLRHRDGSFLPVEVRSRHLTRIVFTIDSGLIDG